MGGNVAATYNPGIKKSAFINALVGLIAGANTTLKGLIPANDDDPINIAYYYAPYVTSDDVLISFVQSNFNLSTGQITQLLATASKN